jgi:hypothetical protein
MPLVLFNTEPTNTASKVTVICDVVIDTFWICDPTA